VLNRSEIMKAAHRIFREIKARGARITTLRCPPASSFRMAGCQERSDCASKAIYR